MNATQLLKELISAKQMYEQDADLEALAIRLLYAKPELVGIGNSFGRLNKDFGKAVIQYNELIGTVFCEQFDQGVEHLGMQDCNPLYLGISPTFQS